MTRPLIHSFVALTAAAVVAPLSAQTASSSTQLPRVVIPTNRQPAPTPPPTRTTRLYPWRTNITATVFWIGERPTANNPTPNDKSSWDPEWVENFGGYDDPDPANRIASHATSEFRPKNFIPKLNPFYIALPYNDVAPGGRHRPEAARVVPWFDRVDPAPGHTSLKGRWVQIYRNGRSCYAQWEDCGPWVTDDWHYVFGDERPKNRANRDAAIDISPAVRDYLGLRSGQECHWRFVEASQVPHGPWKKYGRESSNANRASEDREAKRRYLEYLRRLRDEQYRNKTKVNRTR
jgi:hypothetical protein